MFTLAMTWRRLDCEKEMENKKTNELLYVRDGRSYHETKAT